MSFWSKLKKKAVEDEILQDSERLAETDTSVETDATSSARYNCTDMSAYPVGENSHLVYTVFDRAARIEPSHLVTLAEGCQPFKTLDEHAGAFRFTYSRDGVEQAYFEAVRDQLDELREVKLLISETELLDLCRTSAQTAVDPPPIATIGVVTRNRRQSLERCLRSYIENSLEYGRKNDFAVMDDTQEALERAATREMLQELKREYGVEMRYAGAEEKQEYARALIESGDLSAEVVNFALFDVEQIGFTSGANRNALFLHTAGDMFFSTDDDAVCRVAGLPAPEEDLELDADSSASDPMQFWFYPDRETALRSARIVEQDLLAIYEQLLGRDVASCVAAYGEVDLLNISRLAPYYLRSLQSGAGRVLVALTGMMGDSGTSVPATYKSLNRDSRLRLIESEETYLSARTSREMLRMVARPGISRRTWFISTALAYDNRLILPPFVPVGRGADGVFADTLRVCFENGYFGDLPWSVLHLPLEARAVTPEQIHRGAQRRGLTQIILACVMSKQFWPNLMDGETRLRFLGEHLQEIASMALDDFEEFVQMHVWHIQSTHISELEGELQAFQGPPEYWVEDVEEYLQTVREALTRPDYIVPHDLRKGRSLDEARDVSQRLVLKFGELLCAWPDIVARAKELRAQGQRLAVPI